VPSSEEERQVLAKTLKYVSINKENVDEHDLSALS